MALCSAEPTCISFEFEDSSHVCQMSTSCTESLLTSYSAGDAWIKLNIEPGYAHYDGNCPGQNGVCTSSNLPCESATTAAGGIQVCSALGRTIVPCSASSRIVQFRSPHTASDCVVAHWHMVSAQ